MSHKDNRKQGGTIKRENIIKKGTVRCPQCGQRTTYAVTEDVMEVMCLGCRKYLHLS